MTTSTHTETHTKPRGHPETRRLKAQCLSVSRLAHPLTQSRQTRVSRTRSVKARRRANSNSPSNNPHHYPPILIHNTYLYWHIHLHVHTQHSTAQEQVIVHTHIQNPTNQPTTPSNSPAPIQHYQVPGQALPHTYYLPSSLT
jgi:hypothetical protein